MRHIGLAVLVVTFVVMHAVQAQDLPPSKRVYIPIEKRLVDLELKLYENSARYQPKHPIMIDLQTRVNELRKSEKIDTKEYKKYALVHLVDLMVKKAGHDLVYKDRHPNSISLSNQIRFFIKQSRPLSLKKDIHLIKDHIIQLNKSLDQKAREFSKVFKEQHPQMKLLQAQRQKAQKFLKELSSKESL